MQTHRFRDFIEGSAGSQNSASTVPSNGFMACPLLVAQAMQGGMPFWQMAIYQLAFEQAQAAQRPAQSLREFTPSLN